MNKLNVVFTKFMNTILKIALSIVIIASVGMLFVTILDFNAGTIVFTFAIMISLFLGYKIINSNLNNKQKICLLLLMAATIRILWLLNADNTPVSDFKVMYEAAKAFAQGDSSYFKGNSYIARFPHLTITVLYMSLIEYLSPQHNLLVMKVINLFLGLLVLVLIYFISYELFNDRRKALLSLLIGSIFPPFVAYTSVFCSENLAMPFYLSSVYLFFKSMKSDKYKLKFLGFSSAFLAIGNICRMIATVILIAYILYIIIYFKDKILRKLLNILFITIPYIMIIVLVSNILQNMNITENQLWRGSEPKITNVLKGTNINNLGMWNVEDAQMVEKYLNNYDELEEKCKKIIYLRLTTNSPVRLFIFYVVKLAAQWCIGDYAGSLWTQKDIPENQIIFKIGIFGSMPFQLFYIIMLILIFLGLKDKENINLKLRLDLFYLIFCGYIAAYLITENQSRYGYIVCWLFIILAVDGVSNVKLLNNIYKLHQFKLIKTIGDRISLNEIKYLRTFKNITNNRGEKNE
ncbi:glycosyltransferase family 39 protein [Clostridium beijerinckii]|uniref:Dolichyl-phosphate-mannose-protein mannosyltransferase n=1 Tax=Clostridium beijerinckii TaxID=1520 RepID=A0A1S8S029_CLOBE|nr:glycosyltransferase family 39 protein [Clostridium beijerinckii]NRY59563.1 hypothetical protein [Clostridium beijerinckii]OOM58796.1 dolichyl-phosphate-mannose-protein mannosyltransferase [Clostridium beijerinckii]